MEDDILQIIEEEIASNPSLEEIKTVLLEKGYQEEDISHALHKYSDKSLSKPSKDVKRNIRLFTTKEVFDRIGYGFATHQFINILFYNTALAAGLGHIAYFIVGLFNGLKNVLSVNISAVIQEYSKVQVISKRLISGSGILFGFSFLLMAFARSFGSVELFAFALLLGSVGVVTYGDLYNKLLRDNLKRERMGAFLSKISQWGVLITAVALLLSGWLMDTIPSLGKDFTVFGMTFRAYGYLISFEITALAFILSGYVLSHIKQSESSTTYRFRDFLKEYSYKTGNHLKQIVQNKVIMLLMVTSVLAGLAQALGNSFYGIYIYQEFSDYALGGFLNVAVIYAVAVVVSVSGPWMTKKLNRSIGLAPMLVFGTLLVAMMPFFAGWNPNLYALGVSASVSIIGSSIIGASQGLLARKLLHEKERKVYFTCQASIITIPFLILLPLGSWYAQVAGLTAMFKIITGVLVGIVVPLYIVLVSIANKYKW